jgi:hypothetical protein
MNSINTEFPQFRKLSNNKVFYRIDSLTEFTEITIMGKQKIVHSVKATQFPEKLRILDMLQCTDPFEAIEENEFNLHLDV